MPHVCPPGEGPYYELPSNGDGGGEKEKSGGGETNTTLKAAVAQ